MHHASLPRNCFISSRKGHQGGLNESISKLAVVPARKSATARAASTTATQLAHSDSVDRLTDATARSDCSVEIDESTPQLEGRPYRIEGALNNVVECRRVASASVAGHIQEELEEAPAQRKRGRPKGHKAWNQGRAMPERTKMKIAATQKKRWRSPATQAQQKEIQKGRTPWNKGLRLSPEVRDKMSTAKRFGVLPKKMLCKMSRSHRGLTHTNETRAILSEKLKGRAKSEDHKKAIASGQRRRFEAIRIHQYMQACSSSDSSNESDCQFASSVIAGLPDRDDERSVDNDTFSTYSEPSSPNMYSTGDPFRGKKKQPGKVDANDAIVQDFVAQLREFRGLQRELAPWTDNFKALYGRRPRFEDVEASGIGWLVEKYKEYALTRQKLLCESSQLRSKLEPSPPADQGRGSYTGRLNSNGTATSSAIEGAKRMAKALEYKQSSQQANALGNTKEASLFLEKAQEDNVQSNVEAEAVHLDGDAVLPGVLFTPDEGNVPEGSTASSLSDTNSEMTGKKENLSSIKDNAKNLAGASPRVRAAMLAAAKYKKNKS